MAVYLFIPTQFCPQAQGVCRNFRTRLGSVPVQGHKVGPVDHQLIDGVINGPYNCPKLNGQLRVFHPEISGVAGHTPCTLPETNGKQTPPENRPNPLKGDESSEPT